MKKIYLFILILLCLLPKVSLSAGIFISADKSVFAKDEEFIVKVFLNTEDKRINALEGVVKFPEDNLDFQEIRDGNSSVNFWIERPQNSKKGEVSFSGITTGGFSGDKMFLFSIVFKSKKIGDASISFKDVQVLENDGLGTKVNTKVNPFVFSVSGEVSDTNTDLGIKDENPPEDFSPFLAKDPLIFEGKNFLVFSAVDKGSGIDHYEVRESLFGFGGEYVVAESPYLLKDQTLKSLIYVKAIDKSSNEKIVKINAKNISGLFLVCLIFGIILSICIFSLRKIWKKFFH